MHRLASLSVASCAFALALAAGVPVALAEQPAAKASSAKPAASASANASRDGKATPAADAKGKAAAAPAKASDDDEDDAKTESKPPPAAKNVSGYGYRDPPKKGRKAAHKDADDGAFDRDDKPQAAPRRAAVPAGSPIATMPGFEMLADGASRCFVQLSKSVEVEERKTAGTVTYLLKGARISLRNNHNALETVHFNTPVTRARLVGAPAGLQFVLDLRGNATPSHKLVPAKDGSAIFQVEFPAGKYLPTADAPPSKQAEHDGHR
jgi:hypothetical protein